MEFVGRCDCFFRYETNVEFIKSTLQEESVYVWTIHPYGVSDIVEMGPFEVDIFSSYDDRLDIIRLTLVENP